MEHMKLIQLTFNFKERYYHFTCLSRYTTLKMQYCDTLQKMI
jgi:hypothetical protein